MPFEGCFTAAEKQALVLEYLAVPHGFKGQFLRERGLGPDRIRRWRRQVVAGSLEHGLVPREGGMVGLEDVEALKSVLAENERLKKQLAAEQRAHEKKLAAVEAEGEVHKRAAATLGKAIELLHQSGSKNSEPDVAAPMQPKGEQATD